MLSKRENGFPLGFWKAGILGIHLETVVSEKASPTAVIPGFWLGYWHGFWKARFLEIHLVTVTMVFEKFLKASATHCSNASLVVVYSLQGKCCKPGSTFMA